MEMMSDQWMKTYVPTSIMNAAGNHSNRGHNRVNSSHEYYHKIYYYKITEAATHPRYILKRNRSQLDPINSITSQVRCTVRGPWEDTNRHYTH